MTSEVTNIWTMSYCDTSNQGHWCSPDHYASRNSYFTWLTAVCLATSAMMWYEKKLMVMVLLWYLTVSLFIFAPYPTMWAAALALDLLVYYTLFGNHGDDDEDDDEEEKEDRSSLDPFGERASRELLDAVIEDKLVLKRDEKLIAMLRNKEKLEKEAKRRKREAAKLGQQKWSERLKEGLRTRWERLKSIFYGIDRDAKNTAMDRYVSEQEESQKEQRRVDETENDGLLDEEWINQQVVEDGNGDDQEEDTESTADSTR